MKIINKNIFIYTCYGIISDDLLKVLIKYYDNYNYIFILSQENQQNLKSSSCGYYSLRFLKEFEEDDLNKVNYVIYNNKKNIIEFNIRNEPFDLKKFINYLNVYLNNL